MDGLVLKREDGFRLTRVNIEDPMQSHQLKGSPNLLGHPTQFQIALSGAELPQA